MLFYLFYSSCLSLYHRILINNLQRQSDIHLLAESMRMSEHFTCSVFLARMPRSSAFQPDCTAFALTNLDSAPA